MAEPAGSNDDLREDLPRSMYYHARFFDPRWQLRGIEMAALQDAIEHRLMPLLKNDYTINGEQCNGHLRGLFVTRIADG